MFECEAVETGPVKRKTWKGWIEVELEMVAAIWDDDVWLPANITWEYFDHDDRCSLVMIY